MSAAMVAFEADRDRLADLVTRRYPRSLLTSELVASILEVTWTRQDISPAFDALGETVHDGTRDLDPSMRAAIDAGDTARVRHLTAAVIATEFGPVAAGLYRQVGHLLERTDSLGKALTEELDRRVEAERESHELARTGS